MPKRLNLDEKYRLIMECRQSGLTDRQWCLENGVSENSFYKWARMLRERASFDIPPASQKRKVPAIPVKQDVVRVDIISGYGDNMPARMAQPIAMPPKAPIVIEFSGTNISVCDYADPQMLAMILRTVREALC